jgi:hypothetical protein
MHKLITWSFAIVFFILIIATMAALVAEPTILNLVIALLVRPIDFDLLGRNHQTLPVVLKTTGALFTGCPPEARSSRCSCP